MNKMLFAFFSFSQVTGPKHHLHCLMTLFSFCENIPMNINNTHRTSVCKDVVRFDFFCGFRISKTQRKNAVTVQPPLELWNTIEERAEHSACVHSWLCVCACMEHRDHTHAMHACTHTHRYVIVFTTAPFCDSTQIH